MLGDEGKKHHHFGKSSERYIDADKALAETGLGKGQTFLDVGAGQGYFSLAASRIVGRTGKVYALDVDEASVEAVKKRVQKEDARNIETMLADAAKGIPLGDASIDVCLMANVLHGFLANDEVEGVMREVRRVMRHSGTLAVIEFKKEEGIHGPPVSIRLSPQELRDLLSPYGFEGLRSVDIGEHHYLAIQSAV